MLSPKAERAQIAVWETGHLGDIGYFLTWFRQIGFVFASSPRSARRDPPLHGFNVAEAQKQALTCDCSSWCHIELRRS